MTSMMLQYLEIKNQYKDFILFYRLGDFYEMFFNDAILASRELELTLTGRDCGEAERAPMCGVPYHSAEGYIGKLISKGYKVAICEQMEDPATTKGLVKREVVREITPGTVFESDLIPANKNNYLCAIYIKGARIGICFADVSTGEISATSLDNEGSKLLNELGTYSPSQIIVNIPQNSASYIYDFAKTRLNALCEFENEALFDYQTAIARVSQQFGTDFVVKYENDEPMLCAMGAILEYVCLTQKTQDIEYMNNLNVYGEGQYLDMDLNTRRNLELCETMRNKEKRGSLFGVLDKTKTAMGARMLRSFVEHPLLDVKKIGMRQGAIAELVSNFVLREEISHLMSNILDLERLMTKVVYGSASGKDLRAIASTLSVIPDIKNLLFTASAPELAYIRDNLDTLEDIFTLIDDNLIDTPPFSIREGGMIKNGANPDVDRLRQIMTNGK
ncbi:MAG: DNA mismatch repair protein MutS, partial [Clostridia bacterium]|nr:DNA mismatch repair protein MutS [Clostridia bacterium]